MTQGDGLEDELHRAARVVLTTGARVGEALMRIRQDQQRRAAAENQDRADALARRLHAEQATARLAYRGVEDPGWWDRARPEGISEVYRTSVAWSDVDDHAAQARQRIETEVETRYGVDLRAAGARGAGPALEEAEGRLNASADVHRDQAVRDLVAADLADQAAEGHSDAAAVAGDPQEAGAERSAATEAGGDREDLHAAAGVEWDSAERRVADADHARAAGAPKEAVEARRVADTGQGRPATEATRPQRGRGQQRPAPRRTPSPAVARQRDTSLGR